MRKGLMNAAVLFLLAISPIAEAQTNGDVNLNRLYR
jgi:hypothetical protein